jgi:enamine deaminase RidA (YjgF/YER057c/UK114 family)
MRRRLFHWQGERFLDLGLEGHPGLAVSEQAAELFTTAGQELAIHDLSLVRNVVRTRIFGRTAAARAAGSQARLAALLGRSRAAGSSYISPEHFASTAEVGLELLAMVGPHDHPVRHVTEHEPQQSFIRHLAWGHMVFLAGMTCETRPDLAGQCADILPRAAALLAETGCAFENVVRVSFFLQRDEAPLALLRIVAELAPLPLDNAEVELVEGFSRPGKLVEIEITARRP